MGGGVGRLGLGRVVHVAGSSVVEGSGNWMGSPLWGLWTGGALQEWGSEVEARWRVEGRLGGPCSATAVDDRRRGPPLVAGCGVVGHRYQRAPACGGGPVPGQPGVEGGVLKQRRVGNGRMG